MEHYQENQRDLVDQVELELNGSNNPYSKDWGEAQHKLDAKQRKKMEQVRRCRVRGGVSVEASKEHWESCTAV